MGDANRYVRIIEVIFHSRFKSGADEVAFKRDDIVQAAKKLGIKLPKNLGDVLYSFRFRTPLPESIRAKAPKGKQWIIKQAGKSHYRFVATAFANILPDKKLAETKVPDSTPGIIAKYALNCKTQYSI